MGFSAQRPRAQAPRALGTKTHRYRMYMIYFRSHFPLATVSLEDACYLATLIDLYILPQVVLVVQFNIARSNLYFPGNYGS